MSEDKSIEQDFPNYDLQNDKQQDDNPYLNNPLHGVGLKTVLDELITHYGFDILYAHLNINCFRSNPSLAASAKFLKKTDWAREKVEVFYLYQYKNLPKVSSEQFKLPPRERIVPDHHKPSEPAVLTIEDGELMQEKRSKNAASRDKYTAESKGSSRQYNEQRNARNSSYGKKSDVDSPYQKSNNNARYSKSIDSDSNDTTPSPAKDPWGNFKGGK